METPVTTRVTKQWHFKYDSSETFLMEQKHGVEKLQFAQTAGDKMSHVS